MVSLHHKDRKCAAYSLQPHTVSLHRKDILRSLFVRFVVFVYSFRLYFGYSVLRFVRLSFFLLSLCLLYSHPRTLIQYVCCIDTAPLRLHSCTSPARPSRILTSPCIDIIRLSFRFPLWGRYVLSRSVVRSALIRF